MLKKIIVVFAIVAILLLMFIPAYLNVRFGESENIIKGKLRALYESNEIYRKTHRPMEYAQSIPALTETIPPLLDKEFLRSNQSGYRFIYDKTGGDKYSITAEPVYRFLTGLRTYFVNETGIIRLNNAAGDPIDA